MNDPHEQGPLRAGADPVSASGSALPCADRSAEQATGSATAVRRRSFLEWLTYALGAGAAAVLGVPLVGYFFGTERGEVEWVPLGPVGKFPLNETRVVNFDNPLRTSWDGITAMTVAALITFLIAQGFPIVVLFADNVVAGFFQRTPDKARDAWLVIDQ